MAMTTGNEPLRSHERRSRDKRDAGRLEASQRLRAVALVLVLLAGILLAGAFVHPRSAAVLSSAPGGQLPSVSLTSSAAVEWECPGPLPAGSSADRSSVIIVNPDVKPASVEIQVEAVTVGSRKGGHALPPSRTQMSLGPRSEQVVPLATTGPAQDDAVSVLATAGAVAVFESVAAVQLPPPVRHHGSARQALLSIAPLESPCTTGATTSSYVAAGSTAGQSDVIVSLFDPTATQAVAAIRVSTGSAVITPPALQGLIVKPYSLQIFNLSRWVVQQPDVAVAVSTTIGRVALGAAETVASDPTAATAMNGQALLVGVAVPEDTWVMTPGLGQITRTVSVDVYDPGPRPATVTIASPVLGRPLTEISVVVPAGLVREVELPLPTAGSPAGNEPLPVEGPIVIRTAEGVGVVVARVAVQHLGPHTETVALAAGTAQPSDGWVVPVTAGSATTTVPRLSGGLVFSNPGSEPAVLRISELTTASGSSSLQQLSTLTLAGGSSAKVVLRLPIAGADFAGLIVDSGTPIVAEQDFYALGTVQHPVPVAPVPTLGVAVTG